MDSPKTWYVYLLCDPDTEKPFYVGKGSGSRMYQHEAFVDYQYDKNAEKKQIIRAILAQGKSVLKKKVAEFEVEHDAFMYEKDLIEFYGSILTNRPPGRKKVIPQKIETSELPTDKQYLDELLSANEAGKLLGVSGKTVIRMMEDKSFDGYKIGSYWKFRRGDILRYRESRKYKGEKIESTGDKPEKPAA